MNITYKDLLERQRKEREAFVRECKHEILCIDAELYGNDRLNGDVRCANCNNTFNVDLVPVNELCHWLVEKQKEYFYIRKQGDDMVEAIGEKLDNLED